MRIPSRFRAETEYAKATGKKANVNPPMMAAVGNGDGATFRVANRDNFYWIRLINDANRLTQCFSPMVALAYDDYIYVAKASDRKLTYYEFVSFIQAVGGETSPIINARGIIIPDNVAQGFYIEDDDSVGAGTPEYLRIVTTDGGQAMEFNFGDADVNFIINASALAGAFDLDGATGAITLAGPSMQAPDDWWVGLGGAAGRLVFDSTPAPDQVVMTAADLNMNGNDIIIPDNTAIAFQILDDGAAAPATIDYMQVVTTNAGPAQAVIFNDGEADVDFRICAAAGISDPTDAFFVEGNTGRVYIGDDAPPFATHLFVGDTALNVTTTYVGISSYHIKTAGATTEADDLYGMFLLMEMNHNASVVGYLQGIHAEARLTDGIIGDGQEDIYGGFFQATISGGTANRDVIGFYGFTDINAGVIANDVFGIKSFVDVEAAVTSIGGSIYGAHIDVDADFDPTGSVYMMYLLERTGINWCIYQAALGTPAPSYLSGSLAVGGTSGALAQAHFDQSAVGGNIPVVLLDQADLSDEFINFVCATTGAGDPVDTATAVGTAYARLRISVNGVFKYLQVYNA